MATGSPAAGAGTGLAVGFASGGTGQTSAVAALAVLQRKVGKPAFTPNDRTLLAAFLHHLPTHELRQLRLLMRRDTILRWHRELLNQRHAASPAMELLSGRALRGRINRPPAISAPVHTQSHIDYVIEVVERVAYRASDLPGMRIVSQPRRLRHFTARFEPTS